MLINSKEYISIFNEIKKRICGLTMGDKDA
jgi:hypothetical protein